MQAMRLAGVCAIAALAGCSPGADPAPSTTTTLAPPVAITATTTAPAPAPTPFGLADSVAVRVDAPGLAADVEMTVVMASTPSAEIDLWTNYATCSTVEVSGATALQIVVVRDGVSVVIEGSSAAARDGVAAEVIPATLVIATRSAEFSSAVTVRPQPDGSGTFSGLIDGDVVSGSYACADDSPQPTGPVAASIRLVGADGAVRRFGVWNLAYRCPGISADVALSGELGATGGVDAVGIDAGEGTVIAGRSTEVVLDITAVGVRFVARDATMMVAADGRSAVVRGTALGGERIDLAWSCDATSG